MRSLTVGLLAAALAGCGLFSDDDDEDEVQIDIEDREADDREFDDRRDAWRTQSEHIYPAYIIPYAPPREDLRSRRADEDRRQERDYDERLGRDRILVVASDLEWKEGPDLLPAGARMAVLSGDPRGEGLYTLRLRLPADYRIPPHMHSRNSHVTVISGTFHLGYGDEFSADRGTALPAGSYAFVPAGASHYAWTTEETVIQIHGRGPKDIRYLRVEDDPRKK